MGPLQFRITIACAEPLRKSLRDSLTRRGHQIVADVGSAEELLRRFVALHPDLVVADTDLISMDVLEEMDRVNRGQSSALVLVSSDPNLESIRRGALGRVAAMLVKPIQARQVEAAIAVAVPLFHEIQVLRREAADLRQALEDRKLIERAKGILMKRTGLDEPAAFRRLQRTATNTSRKMTEVARMILVAEHAFDDSSSLQAALAREAA